MQHLRDEITALRAKLETVTTERDEIKAGATRELKRITSEQLARKHMTAANAKLAAPAIAHRLDVGISDGHFAVFSPGPGGVIRTLDAAIDDLREQEANAGLFEKPKDQDATPTTKPTVHAPTTRERYPTGGSVEEKKTFISERREARREARRHS